MERLEERLGQTMVLYVQFSSANKGVEFLLISPPTPRVTFIQDKSKGRGVSIDLKPGIWF